MSKYKDLAERVEWLEEELRNTKARLAALNAPKAIYNTDHQEWMYFDYPPHQKKSIGTVFFGNGYVLDEKPAVKKRLSQRNAPKPNAKQKV